MPCTFAAIPGQETARSILLRACRRTRISHAYIFQGPSGVGKKEYALAAAAYFNCLAPSDDDSCGRCAQCKKIAAGNHPDVHLIEPDGALIKINQVRELKKILSYPPFEAGYRVVILADIHETMRRKEVANSLLKTLEEPPAHTVFILTAEETMSILATIASRCQKIPFYPLANEALCAALTADGIEKDRALALASIGEGSLGRARVLAQGPFLELRREVTSFLSTFECHQPEAVEKLFDLSEKTAKLKDEMADFFGLLKLWLRDLMFLAAGLGEEQMVNRDLHDLYARVKDRWNLSELSDKVRHIQLAETQLQHNCNKSLVCEVLYWRLMQ